MSQSSSSPSTTVEQAAAAIEREVLAIHHCLMRYPWDKPAAYGAWLAQTYYYVRQVSRVLSVAAAHTPLEQGELHEHFLRAIQEEKDHAVLALNDMADLGLHLEAYPEHPLTKAFYQTLMYLIERHGPAALLGYFFVLEGAAGREGKPVYDLVLARYEGKAASFMHEHVILDAEHYPRSLELLHALTPEMLRVVAETAHESSGIYRAMVGAIQASEIR